MLEAIEDYQRRGAAYGGLNDGTESDDVESLPVKLSGGW